MTARMVATLFAAAVCCGAWPGLVVRAQTLSGGDASVPPAVLQLDPPPLAMPAVTGVPFTAEGVTVITQRLADGNRIQRRYGSRLARDSAGRYRQQMEVALLGLAGLGGMAAKVTTILDPVSRVSYALDDDRAVGRRATWPADPPSEQSSGLAKPAPMESSSTRTVGGSSMSASVPRVSRQDLGARTIQGLHATGTVTTTTFAADSFGNEREVVVVTERWISTELRIAVRIERTDPRIGHSVYTLTNVVRREPDTSLFEVPARYTMLAEPRRETLATR